MIVRYYKSAFSGLSREVWLLALTLLVNRSGTMVLPFLALYVTNELGLTPVVAGKLLAGYGLGAIVGAYLGGLGTDRLGAIRTQGLSLWLSGFTFLAMGQTHHIPVLSGLLFLQGVFSESYRPASMSAAAAFSDDETRTRAFALMRLAVNAAMTIGPAVGGLLALRNYELLFWVNAGTSMSAAVLLRILLFKRETKVVGPKDLADGTRRSPWKDLPFAGVLALTLVIAVVFMQSLSTFPLFLRDYAGLIESEIGLLFAVNTVLIILLEMVIIKSVEKLSLLRVCGVGSLLTCVGFALLPLGQSYVFLMFTVVIWTVGEMLFAPLLHAIAGARANAASRGAYLASVAMAHSIAFVVAAPLGTWVYERFGPSTLWGGIGVMGFGVAAGFWLLAKPFEARN